jgi:hypothetical protein
MTNRRILLKNLLPVVEKVCAENLVLSVFGLDEGGEESSNLLCLGCQRERDACKPVFDQYAPLERRRTARRVLTIVLHLDMLGQRNIRRWEHDSVMFKRGPLDRVVLLAAILLPPFVLSATEPVKI